VGFQHTGEITDVDRRDTLVVETVGEVTTQRMLCVIASSSPASIQFSNATAAGLTGAQQ
jgi:hypothetical protein